MEVLTTLGRQATRWEDLLVYIMIQRLDAKTRHAWETVIADFTTSSTYAEVEKFFSSRIIALEAIEHGQGALFQSLISDVCTQISKHGTGKVTSHNVTNPQEQVDHCAYCKQAHCVFSCENLF